MIFNPMNLKRAKIRLTGILILMAGCFPVFNARASDVADAYPVENGSISVQQAIGIGLKNSWRIKAAVDDKKAAQAQTRSAQSQNGAQISTNGFFTAGDMTSVLSSPPGSMPSSINSVPNKGYLGQNLMLMAPIYTGGKLVNLIHAARGMAHSKEYGVTTAQTDIAYKIRSAYYLALYAQSLADVAHARVTYAQELVKNTQAEFAAGKGIQASVDRSNAELADAQRMLTSERNDEAKALLNLKAVMGISLDSNIALSDHLEYVTPTGNKKMWITQARNNLPELLALKSQIASARSSVSAVKAEYDPQIYGVAMANGFASDSMGDGTGYTVGVTVGLPLFDNGQRSSDLDAAKDSVLKLEAEYQDMQLHAESNVRISMLDLKTADENHRSALAGMQSAQSAYDVIALRVENNKGILVEQLDALATLIQAKANLALALYQDEIANAELLKATGRL